jgi:biopolymer transport protein ExbD
MQFDTGDRSSLQSEINITPLVDVVLVLLIIFMVLVPMMMDGYDVDIARTSTDAAPTQALSTEDSQVVLSIVPDACPLLGPPSGEGLPSNCRVTLAGQKIPPSELPQRVANLLGARPPEKRVLFLSADDRMNYEGVLRILDLAKSNVAELKIEFLTVQ